LPRWPSATGTHNNLPGAFGISRNSFREIDTLISSLRTGSREFQYAMNVAAELLAKTSQGFVQQKMRGPYDPQQRRPSAAWRIPVRRITQRTYRGWRVRQIRPGMWELFNDERGAYVIETGMTPEGKTVGNRRPVLKMSAVATLRFVQRTRFAERIMADTFGSLRTNRGQFRSFSARMRGSSLLGITGPTGSLP